MQGGMTAPGGGGGGEPLQMLERGQVSRGPSQFLLQALERMSLATSHLVGRNRLPFLRRNIRSSVKFSERSKSLKEQVTRSIIVAYRINDETSFEGHMNGYCCPLCTLFRSFDTRDLLDGHLKRDHGSCTFSWSVQGTVDVCASVRREEIRSLTSCDSSKDTVWISMSALSSRKKRKARKNTMSYSTNRILSFCVS